MKRKIRSVLSALLCALMLLSASACGSSDDVNYDKIPESTSGKDLVAAQAADDVFSLNCNSKYSFNPLTATNHFNQLVCALVYENLVEVDNDFNVIPNIITDWYCSADGKEWTLTVDTTHTFHNGDSLNAYDVRYSIERAVVSDRYSGRFASVQGVSYWAEDTVYVTLGIGDKQFINLLNIPVIEYGTNGDDHPEGSGPYTYNEDFTELHAYEGYEGYKDLPYETIYLVEYTDPEEIISAFEDGYIDFILNDPSSYTNLGYASSNEIHTYSTTNMHYVGFNVEKGICQYSTFRYAMQFAFYRAGLEEALNDNAVAAALPMNPSCSLYPTDVAAQIPYSLNACLTVLRNAGVQDYDEDGWLEYMNGSAQDIELTFILCSDSSAKASVANRFADDMASIGLKVNVKELTWSEYTKALTDDYEEDEKPIEFDMYYAETKLRNNFDLTEILEVRTEDNESSNINFSRSTDNSFLNYINTYLTADETERAYRYKELCQYLVSNSPIVVIGFEKQQVICHRGVIKGLDPNLGNPFYGIMDWEIMA